MFSSRVMLFPTFLEEQKFPWGGGGEAFIYFLEKQFFLISCFLRVFYAISNSFRFFCTRTFNMCKEKGPLHLFVKWGWFLQIVDREF